MFGGRKLDARRNPIQYENSIDPGRCVRRSGMQAVQHQPTGEGQRRTIGLSGDDYWNPRKDSAPGVPELHGWVTPQELYGSETAYMKIDLTEHNQSWL